MDDLNPSPPPGTPASHDHGKDVGIALPISLACAVLLFGLLLQQCLYKHKVSWITESGACMVLGFFFNALIYMFGELSPGSGSHQLSVRTSPSLHDAIYYGLLPPIIFEAGFTMKKRQFFANFGTIVSFAVLGTLIAIFATGGGLFLLGRANALGEQLSFSQACLFGALISSTDPVAALGILKRVDAPPLLFDLIFGESALNDCISIVLFDVFRRRCEQDLSDHIHHHREQHHAPLPPGVPSPPSPPPGSTDPGEIMAEVGEVTRELLVIMLLSMLFGLFVGLASAFVTKRLGPSMNKRPHAELSLLLVFATGCYMSADQIKGQETGGEALSAILALFFCGITMRHYTFHNLSATAQGTSRMLFRTVSSLCDTALAVLLGISLVDYLVQPSRGEGGPDDDGAASFAAAFALAAPEDDPAPVQIKNRVWDWKLVVCALGVLPVARALNVFPLSAISNMCRKPAHKVTAGMQTVMWFAGMRGAVSFALAMTLDDTRQERQQAAGRSGDQIMPKIVTTTLAVILFTNLIMAPLTGPLIRSLRLSAGKRVSGFSSLMAGGIASGIAGGNNSSRVPSPQRTPPLSTSLLPPVGAPAAADARDGSTSTVSTADAADPPGCRSGSGNGNGGAVAATGAGGDGRTTPSGDGLPAVPQRLAVNHRAERPDLYSSLSGAEAMLLQRQLEAEEAAAEEEEAREQVTPLHAAWRILDQHYLKPVFGGRPIRTRDSRLPSRSETPCEFDDPSVP